MVDYPTRNLKYHIEDMPFVVNLFNYISEVRPGLQFPILYTLCARLSSAIVGGRSLILIGEKGCGKGETIKITMDLFPDMCHLYTDILSEVGMIMWLKKFKLENRDIEASVDDLSLCADDYKHFFNTLNVASKLQSDKIIALTNKDMARMQLKNKDRTKWTATVKSFSCIFGATNSLLKRIRGFEAYPSMWSDRLTEFYLILTLDQYLVILERFVNKTEGYDKVTNKTVHDHIRELIPGNLEIPKKPLPIKAEPADFAFVREALYKRQHTDIRGSEYFRGDLSALALLNGRKYITESDLAFYLMYVPNLNLSRSTSICQRLAQNTLKFNGDLNLLSTDMRMSIKAMRDAVYSSDIKYGKFNNPVRILGNKIILQDSLNRFMQRQEQFITRCREVGGDV